MSIIVVLDAGHGGNDPGAVGNGLQEKEIVLYVVKKVEQILSEQYAGVKCMLTRKVDEFVSLSNRTKRANNWKADCFVSVHVNSASSDQANGYESFIYTSDNEQSKSHALQKQLDSRLSALWTANGRKNRGSKKANYHVLREFKSGSVLVELGFISNAKDAELLSQENFLDKNAELIANGIASYFGLVKSGSVKQPVYRVIVDGSQVGAYSDPDNVAQSVLKAVESGKQSINLELVK